MNLRATLATSTSVASSWSSQLTELSSRFTISDEGDQIVLRKYPNFIAILHLFYLVFVAEKRSKLGARKTWMTSSQIWQVWSRWSATVMDLESAFSLIEWVATKHHLFKIISCNNLLKFNKQNICFGCRSVVNPTRSFTSGMSNSTRCSILTLRAATTNRMRCWPDNKTTSRWISTLKTGATYEIFPTITWRHFWWLVSFKLISNVFEEERSRLRATSRVGMQLRTCGTRTNRDCWCARHESWVVTPGRSRTRTRGTERLRSPKPPWMSG